MPHKASTARSYKPNSPQAAARLVALALMANGEIKAQELAALDALQARERLGLSDAAWHDVLDALCVDLLEGMRMAGDGLVDGRMLARCLAEVDDPALQCEVMRLCTAVVKADGHVDLRESLVLAEMLAHWALPADEQAGVKALLHGLDFRLQPRHASLVTQ